MKKTNNQKLRFMLECDCPFQSELREKVIRFISDATADEMNAEAEHSNEHLFRLICSEMERFLISYPTRPIFKQHLSAKLKEWIKSIEHTFCLHSCYDFDGWPEYIANDLGVELIKKLHTSSEENTKEKLATELKVSQKTIQTALRRLDPHMSVAEDVQEKNPFRIGGQAMHVKVTTRSTSENYRENYYYTANTLHPLALQMNVTQTAAVLISLHNSVEREEFGSYCLDIAMDIWCQLSDYCKSRIEKIFTPNRPEFKRFLDSLNYGLAAGNYPEFRTERLEAEGGTDVEMLDYAYKTGHLCNLHLKSDDQETSHQKNRIFKNDNGRYFCAPNDAENPAKEGIWFTIDDVRFVTLV